MENVVDLDKVFFIGDLHLDHFIYLIGDLHLDHNENIVYFKNGEYKLNLNLLNFSGEDMQIGDEE